MAINDRERCCCFCDARDWYEAVAVLAEGAFLPRVLARLEDEEEEALLHRGIARGAVRESIAVSVFVQCVYDSLNLLFVGAIELSEWKSMFCRYAYMLFTCMLAEERSRAN